MNFACHYFPICLSIALVATARGRVREGDVPSSARSAKLNLLPFYKVNGKLKRGPLQHLKMATGSVLKSFYAAIV
jgi:hypothetical protein